MGNDREHIGENNGSTANKWIARVGDALRNLNDRSALNRSPLVKTAYVEKLAKKRYKGHLLPKGLALRELLSSCVEKICKDLKNEPALLRECMYLKMLKDGLSCQQISHEMGLSREHVSRVYRRNALELLAHQFQYAIKNHD